MGRDPLFRPMLKLIGERYEETKDWFAKIPYMRTYAELIRDGS